MAELHLNSLIYIGLVILKINQDFLGRIPWYFCFAQRSCQKNTFYLKTQAELTNIPISVKHCSTITLPLSSAMKTKGHVLHVFGDYFKCHSIDRICSNTALVRVRSLIIATVSLFGLSVEKPEKDNLLCTSQMMNATSLIFSKTYMALEEKF